MTRYDYDVWFCDRCQRDWTVPSLPHNPNCPSCGRPGWFRRFITGEPYEVTPDGKMAVVPTPETTTRKVRCRCKRRDRHFGVCKCHRHKGDTVGQLTLYG